MSDWEPRSLTPTNRDWEYVDNLQVILQENPARISSEELVKLQQALHPEPMGSTHAAVGNGPGGFQDAPSTIGFDSRFFSYTALNGKGLMYNGSALDLQQGLVDYVRYFLPGSEFNPRSASETFDLGEFLLELFNRLLSFPGGALLAHSVLTTLGREVPELAQNLYDLSDMSVFEMANSRLGRLFRKLVRGFAQRPIATPTWLQGVENFIHATAADYRAMEALDAFSEPDFLSRLFQWASNHLDESLFPGQKAGVTGVLLYVAAMVVGFENPEAADLLFAGGDMSFNLSTIANLGNRLKYLRIVDTAGDLLFLTDDAGNAIRLIDDLAPGVVGRSMIYVDGVLGGARYIDAFVDLITDPALNPNISGELAWRARIGTMFTGISGAFSFGALLMTIIAGGAALVPLMVILATICSIAAILILHWEQFAVGLESLKDSWDMLTQIVIPYRLYQEWRWFDDNIGRPVRENILQPIGQWASSAWNGVTVFVQSLSGE